MPLGDLTPEEFRRLHDEIMRNGVDPDITWDRENGVINWAAIRKEQQVNGMHNEVHVCNFDNGHEKSVDCWCEPTVIRRIRNRHGIDCLVVEHEDFTAAPRGMVIAERNTNQSLLFVGRFVEHPLNKSIDAPWITRTLAPYGDPPPLLDPHERNL